MPVTTTWSSHSSGVDSETRKKLTDIALEHEKTLDWTKLIEQCNSSGFVSKSQIKYRFCGAYVIIIISQGTTYIFVRNLTALACQP